MMSNMAAQMMRNDRLRRAGTSAPIVDWASPAKRRTREPLARSSALSEAA